MILMKLENAELKHIERIVAISKAAFDSDIDVGAPESNGCWGDSNWDFVSKIWEQ